MEPKKSAFPVALKYAIITSLASFIFSVILYMTGLYLNNGIQWLGFIILLVGLIFTIKDRRDKDLGGFITFGQAFGAGFLFCIIVGLIGVLTTYIMMNFIAPDMVEQLLKVTEQKLIDKGMSDDQIQVAMNMTKKFMTPVMMAVWTVVGTAFIGCILSLIVAAIMKKESKQLQQPQ